MGSLKLMRRLLPLVALLAALTFAASGSAATLFVIKGKGWGHGVGMSQWGAYGKARQGATWREIVRHYYRNTSIGERSGTIRVFLAGGRSSVNIGSQAAFKVGSKTHASGSPRVRPTPNGRIKVGGIENSFASPVTFRPIGSPLKLHGSPYHGTFKVSVVGGLLRVVNVVGLEDYVAGVVTHESPAWWGDVGAQAALKAQAVAARSYALAGPGHCPGGTYCPDTSDQVYGPISSETANGRAAVQATAHKVILHAGAVAKAYFYSSSGGQTAASADVWGGNPGYLESVNDSADLKFFGAGQTNPNRSWRALFSPKELGSLLGTPNPRNALVTKRGSGRVRALRVSGPWGSHTFSELAEYFRIELGLKSSRFWMGVQSITADKHEVRCGRAVRLEVFAHDVGGSIAVEQRKESSSTWTRISLNKVNRTHWRTTRHPCTSMVYRVKSAHAVGPSVHVKVTPDVAFDGVQHSGALAGKANPLLAGSPVTVQRYVLGNWTPVASATLQGDGSFSAAFDVQEGVYRAKIVPPPSTDLGTGFSPVLHVVAS
jgi:stage II sporulation protein D